MILLIAGSRAITDIDALWEAFASVSTEWEICYKVVCGCADGADKVGFEFARQRNKPVEFFPAWPRQLAWAESVVEPGEIIHALPTIQGRQSGYIRNAAMAQYVASKSPYGCCILLWDGKSRGTKSMKDLAERYGIPTHVEIIGQEIK